MTQQFDCIVIGLGAMGAATLYQLAKRGRKVLGIDRYAPPHTMGSTHGDTRITRLACGEDAVYTASARRSHEIWRALEQTSGEQLMVQNGFLLVSGPGQRASAHGNPEFFESTVAIARQNGVAHELLSSDVARRRFPAFNLAADDRAYIEPEGGYVFPERCVRVQLEEAARLGATIHTNETMLRFDPRAGAIEVTTDRGSYRADRMVIAAGPWLPQLLPDRAPAFTVRRQTLLWFAIDDVRSLANYRPEAFPVFYWQVPDRRQSLYGFPWTGEGEPAVKLATEQYDTQTTPEAVDRAVSAAEIAEMHRDYVAAFLPGVGPRCVKSAVCLYTCVDGARFIVDTLPGEPRIVVASPCSGHGFKHSAALGEAIAELQTTGRTSHVPLDHFRWQLEAAE